MKISILLLPLLVLFLGPALGGEPQSDSGRLQGTWRLAKAYGPTGKETRQEELEQIDETIHIQGDVLSKRTNSSTGYHEAKSRIDLYPSQSPKGIDRWAREDNPPRNGIYRIDGDKLEIAWESRPENGVHRRPKMLAACPEGAESKWTYSVYQRAKP